MTLRELLTYYGDKSKLPAFDEQGMMLIGQKLAEWARQQGIPRTKKKEAIGIYNHYVNDYPVEFSTNLSAALDAILSMGVEGYYVKVPLGITKLNLKSYPTHENDMPQVVNEENPTKRKEDKSFVVDKTKLEQEQPTKRKRNYTKVSSAKPKDK